MTDRISWVDLREQYLEIPHQTAITKDNAAIAIDFIIFYKVLDPLTSVLSVQDFKGAAINIASTTLRSVVGDMSLDDVLSKREDMNSALRIRLDDVTERWGVKVANVEVREIKPPPAVLEAMTRQMSAERTRRAIITESEGQKQASVTVAEGQKQSSILQAEGERQSAELRAQGFAAALRRILEVAQDVDTTTMTLQYLETLKQIGTSPSTKFVIPVELTSLLGGVLNGNGNGTHNGVVDARRRRSPQISLAPTHALALPADDRAMWAVFDDEPHGLQLGADGVGGGPVPVWPVPRHAGRPAPPLRRPGSPRRSHRRRPKAPSQHSLTAAAKAGARAGSARASRTAPKTTARAPGVSKSSSMREPGSGPACRGRERPGRRPWSPGRNCRAGRRLA